MEKYSACLWLTIVMLMTCRLAQGQDSIRPPLNYLEKHVWRVKFFEPGIANEIRTGPQITFVSEITFSWASSGDGHGFNYAIIPKGSISLRKFYNLPKRLQQNKSIRYNSGNYVATKAVYTFLPIVQEGSPFIITTYRPGIAIEGLWGFQRTYRKNFYLNLECGLAYRGDTKTWIYPAGYCTIGYTFPHRNE